MNIWETINIFWVTLACNLFVKTVFIAVMLDTVLGLLRAIKEKKSLLLMNGLKEFMFGAVAVFCFPYNVSILFFN